MRSERRRNPALVLPAAPAIPFARRYSISLRLAPGAGRLRGWIPAEYCGVGPQSAGADPGPVCYGKDGEEPTVTDANLVLGRLNPGYFLGGEIGLGG